MTESIMYEAQPIPPEDPQDRQRQRRVAIIGGMALIAVLIAGVALGASLFRGGDEPITEATPTTSSPAPGDGDSGLTTTTVPTDGPFAGRNQRSESAFGAGGDYATRPRRSDVGTPTPPLPQRDFTWERLTLDLPAGDESYLHGVYAVDGAFIAVGMAWSETGGQDLTVWRSTDGTTWELDELNGDFSNANVWNVRFTEYGGIAFGEAYSDREGSATRYATPPRVVWTSADGINWTRAELDLASGPNESVWVNTGVAGPDGFVVIGQRETSPEFEPMILEKDGYTVRINDYTYGYEVLDASGTVVAGGSLDDFYGYGEQAEGQAVTNPDSGEVLTIIPWVEWEEAWEAAFSQSSGGPFGGYGYEPPVVTIERDGYRITVDEELFTYTIEDAATGELIASGSADYLWRGPAPVVTDAGGTVILRFSWEEFDAAQAAHWGTIEGEYEYRSEMVVAVSSDGLTWTTSTVEPDATDVSFDSIVAHDGRFLAYGSRFDDYSGGPAIWTSPDGITWTQVADMPGGMWIWNVQQTPDGPLLALGDGPQGQALWSSTDGIAWGEAFGTRIPEDRNLYEYMNQFGTGELGTVVVGAREQDYYEDEYYADPMALSKDGYTLTFDDYDWPPRVTIVDDASGDTVVDVQLGDGQGLPEGFSYEDGVTTITVDGTVILSITDDEWYAAQEARWRVVEERYEYAQPEPTMYFSPDLDEWVEVPFHFPGWISYVAVGRDAIVLAGEEYYAPEPRLEGDHEEFDYPPPTPMLLIGRPTG